MPPCAVWRQPSVRAGSWRRPYLAWCASAVGTSTNHPTPPTNMDRLDRQVEFITGIDRLKNVIRRTALCDDSRLENSAEHSWHLGVMAMVLAEHAEPGVDVTRVVPMVLVHDLVEIHAGDTFAY